VWRWAVPPHPSARHPQPGCADHSVSHRVTRPGAAWQARANTNCHPLTNAGDGPEGRLPEQARRRQGVRRQTRERSAFHIGGDSWRTPACPRQRALP
jgi:hypothetical protein